MSGALVPTGGSVDTRSVVVAGEAFRSPGDLNTALRRWATDIPQDQYIKLLNEAVAKLSEVVKQHDNARDALLIDMYEVGQETLGDDFARFKRTPEYRHIWAKATDAMKNAKKNQNAVQNAKQTVINASLYLEPGFSDLQHAIRLAKCKPTPPPVTQEELEAMGVQLDSWGMLEPYEKSLIEGPPENPTTDDTRFGWAPNVNIPVLPPAVIEELEVTDTDDSTLSADEDTEFRLQCSDKFSHE